MQHVCVLPYRLLFPVRCGDKASFPGWRSGPGKSDLEDSEDTCSKIRTTLCWICWCFCSSQVETFISDVQVGDQLNTVTPQVNSPVLRSQRCHTDTGRTHKGLTERLMLQHVRLSSVALLSSTQISSVFTTSLTYLELLRKPGTKLCRKCISVREKRHLQKHKRELY